jgi:hypothetical protein
MEERTKKLVMELSSLIKAFENESGRKCTKATMSRGKNNADIMKLWTFDFERTAPCTDLKTQNAK